MNPQTLLLLAGGSAILWWLSQKKTPATTSAPPSGAPATTPQAPAAQPPATPPTSPVTPPAAKPPAAPPPMSLAEAFAKMTAAEKQDPTLGKDALGNPLATFSQHNWYLNQVTGHTDPLPDFFTATGGSEDPNIPFASTVYQGIISPWLTANRGMSGLGMSRPWAGYVGPGGWRA